MSDHSLLAMVAAVAAVLVAVLALLRWRRALRVMGARVLIGEAMHRRGVTPADAEAAGLEAEVFAAGARCESCVAEGACRIWLSELAGGGLPDACPNRDLLDRVAAHKASGRGRGGPSPIL